MKITTKILLIWLFTTSFFACKKDKLEGNFDRFEGKWKWIYTYSRSSIWQDFSTAYLNPTSKGYDAYVEITNTGRIKFCIGNDEIEEIKYSVDNEIDNGENIELEIKIKGSPKNLELPSTLHLASSSNDTISFIGFPFNSYETSQYEVNSGFFKREQ